MAKSQTINERIDEKRDALVDEHNALVERIDELDKEFTALDKAKAKAEAIAEAEAALNAVIDGKPAKKGKRKSAASASTGTGSRGKRGLNPKTYLLTHLVPTREQAAKMKTKGTHKSVFCEKLAKKGWTTTADPMVIVGQKLSFLAADGLVTGKGADRGCWLLTAKGEKARAKALGKDAPKPAAKPKAKAKAKAPAKKAKAPKAAKPAAPKETSKEPAAATADSK